MVKKDKITSGIFQCIITDDVQTYLVGGAIRDSLLGRETKDFDFVTSKDPRTLTEKLAHMFGGTMVEISREHEIFRVILKNVGTFDFSKIKGGKIEEDLYARDFSINAMAYCLNDSWGIKKEKIIDPFGGMKDLEEKKIRHLHTNTFIDDPLRMIRAVRLMTRLDFDMDEETQRAIRINAEIIDRVAGERIATEIFAILKEKRTAYYLDYMDKKLLLLDKVFPELRQMKGIGECKYHVVDSLTHSIKTVECIEEVIYANKFFEDHIRVSYENHTDEILSANRRRLELIKLGALFHDIGKPSAKKVDKDGRVRFRGHEITGAKIAMDYAKKLMLSKKEQKILYKYVEMHMAPLVLYKSNDVSANALYKVFEKMGEETLDILLIALADIVSTRKLLNPGEEMGMFKVHVEYIVNNYLTRYSPLIKKPVISGEELMEQFNILEGIEIGELQEKIRKDIYFGKVSSSKESVIKYLREEKNADITPYYLI
ncbi:MAG: CCA tRNA nucleotidyltransferase [Alkaliphilus sp.]